MLDNHVERFSIISPVHAVAFKQVLSFCIGKCVLFMWCPWSMHQHLVAGAGSRHSAHLPMLCSPAGVSTLQASLAT